MNKHSHHIALLFLALTTFSCSVFNSLTGTNSPDVEETKDYFEDLSVYSEELRVESAKSLKQQENYALVPYLFDRTDTINAVLDSIAILNINSNTYTGYSIQLYSSNDYEEAKKMMGKAIQSFQDKDPKLNFQQPNFKIKIGHFEQELTARTALNEAKKVFPSAIIVPETYLISDLK